jgi:hypothetical protein
MTEPEISHRCPACGASIRSRSQFCPQCGSPLKKSASGAIPAAEIPEKQQHKRSDGELKTTPLSPVSKIIETPAASAPAEAQEAPPDMTESMHVRSAALWQPDKSHQKKHRVKKAAREMVSENVRPRVEKIRQASNVVFEEAAIDPSLRFIIIAAFLFIIFVVLLLLSFLK